MPVRPGCRHRPSLAPVRGEWLPLDERRGGTGAGARRAGTWSIVLLAGFTDNKDGHNGIHIAYMLLRGAPAGDISVDALRCDEFQTRVRTRWTLVLGLGGEIGAREGPRTEAEHRWGYEGIWMWWYGEKERSE